MTTFLRRAGRGCWIAVVLGVALGSAGRAYGSDESDVRAVETREIAGWAQFDSQAIASLYTADAIWQNPFGVRLHGSAALKGFLDNLFRRPGYRSAKDTTEAKITDVRILSPTVAVVWSEESSEGQIDDETGKPMQPRHSRYIEVLVKRAGVWRISECMILDEQQRA